MNNCYRSPGFLFKEVKFLFEGKTYSCSNTTNQFNQASLIKSGIRIEGYFKACQQTLREDEIYADILINGVHLCQALNNFRKKDYYKGRYWRVKIKKERCLKLKYISM